MGKDGLFEDLAEQAAAAREARGAPRLREPVRDQAEWRVVDLDSVIGADHPARVIWRYVERLDLRALEEPIKAREGHPGHPPLAPRLMLALWLYATSDGVGSARALARLCDCHDAYRWLCGGVSVNHHTLADFRVGHAGVLDALLTENVAALAAAGVIDLDTVGLDGVRVRAGAGAASFRRRPTLEKALHEARGRVARLKAEIDDDPEASERRIKAAQRRAAAEQEARAQAALDKLAELEAERARRAKTNSRDVAKQSAPCASTTDPDARVMKMADGGFRPAYNLQIASAAERQIVTGVDVDTTGSDHGKLTPMFDQLRRRYGRRPKRCLADGGYLKNADIVAAADPAHGAVELYCPATANKHRTDPYAPRPRDPTAVADWRHRMNSADGKARYKRRSIIECIHARMRNWNIRQFTVRGTHKIRAALLIFALANNILRQQTLDQQSA